MHRGLPARRPCESALFLLFPALSGGGRPRLNPFNPLLHPANTNTPCSHWKTSVFWGQGGGRPPTCLKSSHMKHLVCGQGKQAGRSGGVCSTRGGEGVLFWERERGLSSPVTSFPRAGKKKGGIWMQCAQLHQGAHHPKGNLSQPSCTPHPKPHSSLVIKSKNKASPPHHHPKKILCLTTLF